MRLRLSLLSYVLAVSVALVLVLMFVGRHFEQLAVRAAADTSWIYDTDEVCDSGRGSVLHCGTCGACSNDHDIGVYRRTRDTLTETTTRCALKSLLGGRRAVTECMERNVGLTPECTRCWVDNIFCTKRHCKWSCLLYRLGIGGRGSEAGGRLGPCLDCDEKMCGPAFISCAGANRRRSGIVSDIDRSDAQVCKRVGERITPRTGLGHDVHRRTVYHMTG